MFPDYLVFNAPACVVSWLLERHEWHWTSKISTSVFYTEIRCCGGITLSIPTHSSAPVHVSVTGNGCRELQAAGIVTDWQKFFVSMIEGGAKFSRLDCAIDDKALLLDIDEIIAACEEARVSSHYQAIDPRVKLDRATGAVIGKGVTFGQRESLTYIRIYDKALEQHVPGHWIRVEIEAKKKRAQELAKAIAEKGADVVPAYLLSCLRFRERGQTCRHDRQTTAVWWTKFLGTVKSFRLEAEPRNRSQDANYRWLIRGAGPSFTKYYDGGMGQQLIDEMLAAGRLKQTQQSEMRAESKKPPKPAVKLTTAKAVQPQKCNIPTWLQSNSGTSARGSV